jgi:hypothetical protein
MSIELFVFLAVSLFMIHEFEEIIFVKNWLANGQNNPRLAGDMWLKNAAAYPSTAAIALMIAEEFLLVVILSLIAIWMKFPELAIGMLVAHTIHLIGHIVNAVGVKRWSPGSITAVITLPIICFVIFYFVKTYYFGIEIDWLKMIAGFITASVVLLGNLRLLHRFAAKLNNWITNFYEKWQ